MYFEEFWSFLVNLLQENFKGIVKLWSSTDNASVTSLNWDHIGYWMVFFVIFTFMMVFVLCRSKLLEKLSNYVFSLSLIIWFFGVLVYIVGFYNSGANGFSVVLRAIVSSFKMFVVSNELARVPQFLRNDSSYMTAFSVLHSLAAFITFLFIFKMLGYKMKSSLRMLSYKLWRAKGKVVHVFWGVNEASCLLAEDIYRNHNTETIIFVDIDKENDDNPQRKVTMSHITNTITIKNSEIVRLEAIGALVDHCYNGPAAFKQEGNIDLFGALHLKSIRAIVRKSCRANFYFLSNDEGQNISGALNLQKDTMLRAINEENKPFIYVRARRNTNDGMCNSYLQNNVDLNRMQIKIVDASYLSIATLKQNEATLPVNCVAIDKKTGMVDGAFVSLIIGFGSTGQEAFNFLYEFAAFVNKGLKRSPFKCYAFDEKMDKMSGLVKEVMPAITEEELTLVKTSVDSELFWEKVRTIIDDLNYVVITLGNDEVALPVAVNLFKLALQKRSANLPMLKIMLRCYDNANRNRMVEVVQNLNQCTEGCNVEICLFGMEKDLYCCSTILSDTILTMAKEFNKVYELSNLSADEQWKNNFGENEVLRLMSNKKISRYHAVNDINRRIAQNISNALHSQTKLKLMGFGMNEISERLKLYYGYVNGRQEGTVKYPCSEEDMTLLHTIAAVEHERWVASHKLMGYTYGAETDHVKQCHRCLCLWSDLDEKTQAYDCNVVDTTIRMTYKKCSAQKTWG